MATMSLSRAGVNMDELHLGDLLGALIIEASPTLLNLRVSSSYTASFLGMNFTYDSNEQITGGTLNVVGIHTASYAITISALSTPILPFANWILTDQTQLAFKTLFSGKDNIFGSSGGDLIRGFDGDDQLLGWAGSDTIFGGIGNDYIEGNSNNDTSMDQSYNYLRGDEGDDVILGSGGFDDINGNMGNDTLGGGWGDDWVVGGKDNDSLNGSIGSDIVYGNLGADTCEGGDGADWVRGGQANDLVSGGKGDDGLWGDRGDDTVTGGAGADIFHFFADAGLDRVTDFNAAEGDRVVLDGAPSYTLRQEGSDAVIDLGGVDRMVLVGVSLSSLPVGWISLG